MTVVPQIVRTSAVQRDSRRRHERKCFPAPVFYLYIHNLHFILSDRHKRGNARYERMLLRFPLELMPHGPRRQNALILFVGKLLRLCLGRNSCQRITVILPEPAPEIPRRFIIVKFFRTDRLQNKLILAAFQISAERRRQRTLDTLLSCHRKIQVARVLRLFQPKSPLFVQEPILCLHFNNFTPFQLTCHCSFCICMGISHNTSEIPHSNNYRRRIHSHTQYP